MQTIIFAVCFVLFNRVCIIGEKFKISDPLLGRKGLIFGAFGLVALVLISGFIFIPKMRVKKEPILTHRTNEIIALNDPGLYYLNLTLDYGFDDYISDLEGSQSYPIQSNFEFGCTGISILDPLNNSFFGRNFDWYGDGKLILATRPENGFKSISMVDLYSLETYSEIEISEISITDYWRLAYSPFDGMNECGVAVGCLVSPGMTVGIDPAKKSLGSLGFMRLALDYARNVSEVIELWENFNMDYEGGPYLHYMVADAQGNSVIVEWIDGEMVAIPNTAPWQVVTNFRMYDATEQDLLGCWRFSHANETLTRQGDSVSNSQLMDLLADVSQVGWTKWSNVYDLLSLKAYICIDRKYDKDPYVFSL